MRKILVTGALGQIGAELVPALRDRYGAEAVIASDIRLPQRATAGTSAGAFDATVDATVDGGPFEQLDCTKRRAVQEAVRQNDVGTIYHLAAMLSAVAEQKPQSAWELNMGSLYRILEVARTARCALFFPSSIGAFGPTTPSERAPQDTVQRPSTIYGVTKVAGELLCDYYVARFGVDARGLRLPGLISYVVPPGGGTTDYAVDIFYQAIRYRHFVCPLAPDTRLDMMYMPDAIRATIEVMTADAARLKHHNAFNVTAINVTPEELAGEIRKHIPEFVLEYDVDPVRQRIADSWPRAMDDSEARAQWGWRPRYDLAAMTADMIDKLRARLKPAVTAR
jgi:nucleoside-diphosphate-sugar epimerase